MNTSRLKLLFATVTVLMGSVTGITTATEIQDTQSTRTVASTEGDTCALQVVSTKGKVGYVNANGKVMAPCIYDEIGEFHEGLATVKRDGKWGYIDKTGKEIILCTYGGAKDFAEGLAAVKQWDKTDTGKWGVINNTGKKIIPFRYDDAGTFSEGLIEVKKGDWWGYADREGREVIPSIYSITWKFDNGMALVNNGKAFGYIDKTGKQLIPFEYDRAFYYIDGVTGMYKSEGPWKGTWTYFNKQRAKLFSYKSDMASVIHPFENGYAAIKTNGKWGYVDTKGRHAVPPIYDNLHSPSEGLVSVEKGGKWGFVDMKGKSVVACTYDDAWPFYEGLAAVKRNGKWGFIDKKGKAVTEIKYDKVLDFSNGLASVQVDGKWGFVDKSGAVAIPTIYDKAEEFKNGYSLVTKNGKEGYIDTAGKWISNKVISLAELYGGKKFVCSTSNGAAFKCVVNKDGESATILKGNANGAKVLVVPNSISAYGTVFYVSHIDDFAFTTYEDTASSAMKGVKILSLPEGIKYVGQNCFEGAPDLETVLLPSSLTAVSYFMFGNCPKLKNVHFPKTGNITRIESFAFANCPQLTRCLIPSYVEEIAQGPWRGCTSMETFAVDEKNYNFNVYDGALYSTAGKASVLIQYPAGKKDKSYMVMYGTEKIGNSAFYGSVCLESVSLPASLDSISHLAFFDCAALNSVQFSDSITFIGNKAFRDCPNLKKITLYGNPRYTTNDNSYDTFEKQTKTNVEESAPEVKLPKSKGGILTSVFDAVTAMPHFQVMDIKKNSDYGYPDYFGKGRMVVYGNASPKEDVLRILKAIPAKYFAHEEVRKNKIQRYYFNKDKKNPQVLYFFGGTGGNDLVVCLFEGGSIKDIEQLLAEMKRTAK